LTNKTLSRLLPFFDPNELPQDPFIFVCSSRRSGKSTLVNDLLINYFHQEYDFIIGLMGNGHTARQYIERGAIPAKYCHSEYSPEILKAWFEKSDKLLKQGKTLPKTLFVCDDILVLQAEKNKKTTRRDPYLSKLSTIGRHYNAGTILIVQSWNIGLQFVRNSDCVIVSPSSLYAGQDFKQLAEVYMTGDNFRRNKEVLAMFERFDFLVLKYWKATRSQRELLSWYRVNKQTLQYAKH